MSGRFASVDAATPGRIGLAWLIAVGVDLFFNAGLFTTLFDQSREPALLSDSALARRIPVAFLLLAMAVTALAWLLARTEAEGSRAVSIGAEAGLVVGLLASAGVWTAVDVTGIFVAAGVLTATAQGSAAAAVLASPRTGWNLRVRVAITFLLLAGGGQVIANLARRRVSPPVCQQAGRAREPGSAWR